MTRYARKKGKNPPNRRIGKRALKTKTYKKDLDLIKQQLIHTIANADSQPLDTAKTSDDTNDEDIDYDLPANGQHVCQHCDRYFIDEKAFKDHNKSKAHKKRVRLLRDEPYSQEEAERAAGMGSYTTNTTKASVSNKTPVMDTE
ncbi:unnamed protein product [Oppiella nova]|uniref:Zinc finger protein 593 homolog n=1 Tax=Oppiella nova TaxID=334625 RepID=A0A7R9MC00_9ACAR|nr:unnamed protein product [Oppiella nova]CAD7656312.1 unnamed protein product [Oppiella nova]CAG2166364.1 unnamed protein product [Oppiella nova]CAG2173499.1 unnamed protein product [Oppiella nova]